MTYNPALIINIDNKKGSIEVGKDADITVIDEDLNIYITIIEGSIKFKNIKKKANLISILRSSQL